MLMLYEEKNKLWLRWIMHNMILIMIMKVTMMIRLKIFSGQEEGCKKQSTGTTVDMEVNLKMVSIREKRLMKMIMIVVNDDHDRSK